MCVGRGGGGVTVNNSRLIGLAQTTGQTKDPFTSTDLRTRPSDATHPVAET